MARLADTGSRSTDLLRQLLTIVVTIVTLTVNALANILPINGKTTASISDSFDVRFVPADYVFSIWGVIYIALIAYTIYQALPSQRTNPALRSIGWLYILSGIANSIWIFMWHYEIFWLTAVFMLALLGSLIAIYLVLDIGRRPVTMLERWTVHIPFSIYLGWITVATVANITDLLAWLRWDGWGLGDQTWAMIMIVVATLIAALVSLTRRDLAYNAVIVWAFAGIAVKQSDYPAVSITAVVAAIIVAAVAVGAYFFRPSPVRLRARVS